MKTAEEKANGVVAYVTCIGGDIPGQGPCGVIPLTQPEYLRQLQRPDDPWSCPKCGGSADYNDIESERVQGIDAAESIDAVLANITAPVLDEIGIERERQKLIEGYSEPHDDGHTDGALAMAAAAYAVYSVGEGMEEAAGELWPEGWRALQPKQDRRRNLVIAAALIVAEIERLDRAAAKANS